MTILNDFKFAIRSLLRAKGLTATVIATLALGIGANAAIFALVRGVLLRPLVNRDEDRLIYVRQTADGFAAVSSGGSVPFSVPEIRDLRQRIKTLSAFGEFSTIGFTMVGLGEPREVRAGVVDGSYFEVMGLRPVLGRLLDQRDDGPKAAGACVLTYRFWSTSLKSDAALIGKSVRLGDRTAEIIGVLEPSVPYPADTEIIANIVTSPHHLSATMVEGRVHRMTQLFARLAPGATVAQATAELKTVYAGMVKEHPEAYSVKDDPRIEAVLLRDQITSRARTVLLVLLAASGLVFVIACSNVANLILARTVRREGELAIRAALGAGRPQLRRTLLAESLILSGAGAGLGIFIAGPMVEVLSRYAARFSVRAVDVTLDNSMLWVGAGLAMVAACLLAFVPRLPTAMAAGSRRTTGNAGPRLRAFAVTQIAASFVLLAGAGALLKTLIALQAAQTGYDTRHVLVLNVPVVSYQRTRQQITDFYRETIRRIRSLPGVDEVAVGTLAPWRDAGSFGPGFEFSADGHVKGPGEQDPRGRFRTVSPGFFAALGVPIVAGRDFNDNDREGREPVCIISQSLAERMFPGQDAVNRHLRWTDPIMKFIDVPTDPRRIVGVAADVDDESITPGAAFTVYHPFGQMQLFFGRLFVHTRSNPYGLVTSVTKIIRDMSADQPVERAATLEDIRAEVLTPDRLNTIVFGVFAAVALVIAVIGVAGVLAFSVSGRTREFGIRLAVGSEPLHLLKGVLAEGAAIGAIGVAAGVVAGFALARVAASYFSEIRMPGALPVIGSALVLVAAAVVASWAPAARAARVDVIEALRSE